MSGVSGFFSRGADEAVGRLGVHFRDTDPRPIERAVEHEAEQAVYRRLASQGSNGLGLEALIPTRPPIAAAEDERLIASLAAHLAASVPLLRTDPGAPDFFADLIRQWRDGERRGR